jgi:catechol 2,3-dioxygenase-like lactoylglutathione lyase family enzyme
MAITGLHHLHLKVRDLAGTQRFAKDFGLSEACETPDGRVYLHGAGTGAYQLVLEDADESALVGIAFEVDSRQDLEHAIARHGASSIISLDGPGGGLAVELSDPDGKRIKLVHDVETREHDPLPPAMIINQGQDKTRQGAAQLQRPLGPPQLLRLGHVGLFVRDYKACDAWYRDVLGFLPSDVMWAAEPDNLIAGFYRIDRGSEWVDHHTIALFGFGKSDLHHISFEVQNADAQFVGHRWMARHGHEPVWGVGRHPKGSHVFDVWRDPSGYRFETFSDTDVSTAAMPAGVHDITTMEMDLWSDRSHEDYFA